MVCLSWQCWVRIVLYIITGVHSHVQSLVTVFSVIYEAVLKQPSVSVEFLL